MLAMEAEERMQNEQEKKGSSSDDGLDCKDSVFSPNSRLSPRSDAHSPAGRPLPPFPPAPSNCPPSTTSRKRLFDVESLLAPDAPSLPSKRALSESEGPGRLEGHLGHLERSRDSDDDEFIDVDSKVDVENVDDVSEDENNVNVSGDPRDHEENADERPSSREGHHHQEGPARTPSPCSPRSSQDRSEGKSSPSQISPSTISPGNIPVALAAREGPNGLRGHWMSPLSVGTSWPDHPSAFHSAAAAAAANTVTAWSTVAHPAAAGFPVMSAPPYPMHGLTAVPPSAVHPAATSNPAAPTSGEALAAQQRWQETFSRIVARVCPEKNVKVEA